MALEIYSKRAFVWEPLQEARKVEAAGPRLHRHSEDQNPGRLSSAQSVCSSLAAVTRWRGLGAVVSLEQQWFLLLCAGLFHIITHCRFCCGKGITHIPTHSAMSPWAACLHHLPWVHTGYDKRALQTTTCPSALISLQQLNPKLSPLLLLE